MAASVHLSVGTTFAGDFKVNRSLFEAEDRAVYAVEQLSTGRELALKVLSAELLPDDESRARFLDEAKISGKVGTVHVLDVRSVGVDSATGLPWMVSELLEGENLDQRLARETKFPMADWDELLSQVLHGLASVHAVGVHHGALNAESIFLARSAEVNEPFRVELLDFGVPRSARMKSISQATRLAWSAPEQIDEGGTLSPRTDVWAVGLLAFRLLTGKHYFKSPASDAASLEREIRAGATEPASARARALGFTGSLPRAFDDWFGRCVAADPAQRFASATEALEGAADLMTEASGVAGEVGEVVEAEEAPRQRKKPPPLPPMVRVIAENPKPAIALIVLLVGLALAGGFGLGILRGGGSKSAADAARSQAATWSKGSIEACKAACDKGDATACHGLGQMYLYGLKVSKDEGKAAEHFKTACDKGDAPACASLALVTLSGEGTTHDPVKASQLYQKACDLGDAVSCIDLADMHASGNGIPKNEAAAKSLREKACKAGMTEVCAP